MAKQYEIRRYQQRAREQFKDWFSGSDPLATIILPTGTGKTATASMSLAETVGCKILWVAHREELIDQAVEALRAICPGRTISVEMGDRKGDPNSDIIVGSVQTLARMRKHMEGFVPDIIVIDEYHHYSEENVQYDGLIKRYTNNPKVLGLTATPYRFGGQNLPLGRILIQMDIGTAVEKGYLVPPKPEALNTSVSLAEVKTRMGDFSIKDLSKVVNVDSRNQLIAKRIIELVRDQKRQGILFAVDVAHSKSMFDLLRKEMRAAEVYGETPTEERREIMARIRGGEIDVLLNNLVATEGFDVPHLSFVGIARPTRSLSLYTQMTGRGLRTSPGKTDCIVLDVCDKIKIKQNRVLFADMAVAGDLTGDRKRATNILKAPVEVDPIANSVKNFPIFLNKEKVDRWTADEERFTVSSWMITNDQWIVTWTAETKESAIVSKPVLVPWDELPPLGTNITGRDVVHATFGAGKVKKIIDRNPAKILVEFGWDNEKLVMMSSLKIQKFIKEHSPDEFEIKKTERCFYICIPDISEPGRIMSFVRQGRDLILQDDQRKTQYEIDNYLQEQAIKDGNLQLVRCGAKWKGAAASEKQIAFVKSMVQSSKIGFDLDLENLTKGEASSVIEQAKWQQLICAKFGTNYKDKLLGYDTTAQDV
jgi:superfamily II DNA or RNA helicase